MKVLVFALLLCFMTASHAEKVRYYDVEIIIIENLKPEAKNSEYWSANKTLSPTENTIKLGQPFKRELLPENVDPKLSYIVLPSKNYQLTGVSDKISASHLQRVIFHTAWRQPGLDKNTALTVYFKKEVAAAPLTDKNIAELPVQTETIRHNIIAEPKLLEGLLRVTLSRYLHLQAELIYRNKPLISTTDITSTANNSYAPNEIALGQNNEQNSPAIEQNRQHEVIYFKQLRHRMRSNELHYLDHPVLSLLIKITPYKQAE